MESHQCGNVSLNEAWDFLKWWTSAQTQSNYSIELKAADGEAAEYPVANIAAIRDGGLKDEFKEVVLSLMDDLKAEPQIPGSYITGRTIQIMWIQSILCISHLMRSIQRL